MNAWSLTKYYASVPRNWLQLTARDLKGQSKVYASFRMRYRRCEPSRDQEHWSTLFLVD